MLLVLQTLRKGVWLDNCSVRVKRESTFAWYVDMEGVESSFSKITGLPREGMDKTIRAVKAEGRRTDLVQIDARRSTRKICDQNNRYDGTR